MELHALGDPEAAYSLRSREVWAVPFVNPDGYIANENLLHKVIRKNQRPTCDDTLQQSTYSTQSGVDLNRNFGFHWSAQYQPCAEEYQGSAPFSEPETQALKKLIEAHEFKTAVNFHSYGGMLTHPYNFGAKRLAVDDQRFYDEIAKVFQWAKFGPALATVGYPAPGESDDWMYSAHHILSMSPEVGPEAGGFWPASTLVQGIDDRNFHRIAYVVKKAGLEFNASWNQLSAGTTYAGGYLKSLSASAGEPSADVLELRLGNSGLTISSGKVLSVAISGATRPNAQGLGANDMAILERDPLKAQEARLTSTQLSFDEKNAAAAPVVTFQVEPLPNRSYIALQILMAGNLIASPLPNLGICAVEATGIQGEELLAICHCFGSLPMGQSLPVQLVSAGSDSSLGKLCRAATTSGSKAAALPELRTTGLVEIVPELKMPGRHAPNLLGNGLFFSLVVVVAVVASMSISRTCRSTNFRVAALEEEMMPAIQVNGCSEEDSLVSMHDFHQV
jgi:hypothetical protein